MVLRDELTLAQTEKRLTVETYWEITHLPEYRDKRYELVNGALKEMAPSNNENTIIAGLFITFFNLYVFDHPIGYVAVPDGGFTMANGNVRQPDAAFISKKRHPKLKGTVFPIAPDIAVEVISPSESGKDIRDKVNEYLTSGTIYVLCAYPEDRTVDVHTLNADGSRTTHTLTVNDTFDGGAVLPGFKLAIGKVFPQDDEA